MTQRQTVVEKVQENGSQARWVFSPTSLQFFAWAVAKIAGLIIGMWAGVTFVAQDVFESELQQFHREAIPAIEALIDHKLEVHTLEAESPFIERIHTMESNAALAANNVKHLIEKQEEMQQDIDEMDKKLDALLRR